MPIKAAEVFAGLAILLRPALTSLHRADKNADFLRQAVSFANRNGRSANNPLKAKCFRWNCRTSRASMKEAQTLPLTPICQM